MVDIAGNYEIYTSSRQTDRNHAVDLDSGLGHKPTPTPAHLRRVLYIPKHSVLNLSLYDVSGEYQRALTHAPVGGNHILGDAMMGTRLYKTRLSIMNRPTGNGRDDVQYLVELNVEQIRDGGEISATLRRRDETNSRPDMNITLPMLDDKFSLEPIPSHGTLDPIAIEAAYPLPSLRTSAGIIRFPYFRFNIPRTSISYEWQIHPRDHGTLRYTLVASEERIFDIDSESENDTPSSNIKAIYHHVGHDGSLFLPQSEGVLLLPELDGGKDSEMEEIIVASLVGLLWRVRGMEIKDKPPKDGTKPRRQSIIKKLFGKD